MNHENCKTCLKNSKQKNFKLCNSCTMSLEAFKGIVELVEEFIVKGFKTSFNCVVYSQAGKFTAEVNSLKFGSDYESLEEVRHAIKSWAEQ